MRVDPLSTSAVSESARFLGNEPEVENVELMKGTTSLEALIEQEIVLAVRDVVKGLW